MSAPSPVRPSPLRPAAAPPDVPKLLFTRGGRYPQAIAWFGARSFWGHLWHLAASVIATEDIDSRAWMRPSTPDTLTRKAAAVLGGREGAETLTEALDRDVWIDFLADTGDCVSVSQAVARLVFETYEVEDPQRPGETLVLPRGDLLLFGGDTAYPVATELEIHNRVIVPFSRVLSEVRDGKPRVLLGVPGNHDWYAGLDGFGRMFRERRGTVDVVGKSAPNEVVRFAQIGHFIQWVEAFRIGRYVSKRSTLPLEGYVPVQDASYFALRLAPGLDLWGADRQLRAVDFEQRAFFASLRTENRGLLLTLADPAYAFLEPNPAGQHIVDALDLRLEDDSVLVLTGDTHHYCREQIGKTCHVTAGGGGAFLHPARIMRQGLPEPSAEFPGPKASLALALQIPWQIVHGRSGFLVHAAAALLYVPAFFAVRWGGAPPMVTSLVIAAVAAFICRLLGGFRNRSIAVYVLATIAGLVIGFVPMLARMTFTTAGRFFHQADLFGARPWLVFMVSVYVATLVFGAYLMALTILGIEQHQAFAALAHPGYKHFVRVRVRRDGSGTDAWVLGKVDPLSTSDPVVLVDQFSWTNDGLSAGARSALPASLITPPSGDAVQQQRR
ncbi:hypothetical protein [Polyangium sp. 6x1]|uniref:hypothetical protein n=1 Tax=Polyangium sp. 6x1 TaxID=3042689 RepID=UPI0024828E4F|nr:hypothetical protein [Polyangium sp. 6x1]MDI1451200.1 hypothetical protein [Polyangium sp. 6x1]